MLALVAMMVVALLGFVGLVIDGGRCRTRLMRPPQPPPMR